MGFIGQPAARASQQVRLPKRNIVTSSQDGAQCPGRNFSSRNLALVLLGGNNFFCLLHGAHWHPGPWGCTLSQGGLKSLKYYCVFFFKIVFSRDICINISNYMFCLFVSFYQMTLSHLALNDGGCVLSSQTWWDLVTASDKEQGKSCDVTSKTGT